MDKSNRAYLLPAATAAVALAIGTAAYLAGRHQPPDAPPWYSVVPPLLAVSLALITNRLFLSLIAAVLVGGFLAVLGDGPGALSLPVLGVVQSLKVVAGTIYDVEHFELAPDRFNVS